MKLVQRSGAFLAAALLVGCGANGSSFGTPLSAVPGVSALTKENGIHIFQGSPDGGVPLPVCSRARTRSSTALRLPAATRPVAASAPSLRFRLPARKKCSIASRAAMTAWRRKPD